MGRDQTSHSHHVALGSSVHRGPDLPRRSAATNGWSLPAHHVPHTTASTAGPPGAGSQAGANLAAASQAGASLAAASQAGASLAGASQAGASQAGASLAGASHAWCVGQAISSPPTTRMAHGTDRLASTTLTHLEHDQYHHNKYQQRARNHPVHHAARFFIFRSVATPSAVTRADATAIPSST